MVRKLKGLLMVLILCLSSVLIGCSGGNGEDVTKAPTTEAPTTEEPTTEEPTTEAPTTEEPTTEEPTTEFESVRPVAAQIDEMQFTLALNNLVENAIKYNKEHGYVRVSVNADHKYFYIKITDSGIGIPPE